jgi:biopolymer transport protein ExbD
MAGSQDPSDNPVAVNVVPLVDIIFCLCVFFMCSFKFRQLEGKFETWLPKTQGHDSPAEPSQFLTEMRVALLWDPSTATVTRKFGARVVNDDVDLARAVAEARDSWSERGVPDAPLTIDADVRVPWDVVTHVVDVAKRAEIARIQFALGAAPTRGGK